MTLRLVPTMTAEPVSKASDKGKRIAVVEAQSPTATITSIIHLKISTLFFLPMCPRTRRSNVTANLLPPTSFQALRDGLNAWTTCHATPTPLKAPLAPQPTPPTLVGVNTRHHPVLLLLILHLDDAAQDLQTTFAVHVVNSKPSRQRMHYSTYRKRLISSQVPHPTPPRKVSVSRDVSTLSWSTWHIPVLPLLVPLLDDAAHLMQKTFQVHAINGKPSRQRMRYSTCRI